MSKIAAISFTKQGSSWCEKIQEPLKALGYEVESFSIERYAKEFGLQPLQTSLKEWTKAKFHEVEHLLFIGACGIAVRSIAPFIQDKTKDPAVVVMDEQGHYIISLLSGHIGGANQLAVALEDITKGTAVITTATDVNGLFAIDVFAKKNHLTIASMKEAKYFAASLLDGNTAYLYSELPVEGELPKGVAFRTTEPTFTISIHEEQGRKGVWLIPKIVSIGIGCKRHTTMEDIEEAVTEALKRHKISPKAVEHFVSVDLKKNEPGLHQLARKYRVPFHTYSVSELKEVEGEFTSSAFVKGITGVSNICERSAVKGSKQGILLQKKLAGNGVTVAIAMKEWSVKFE